MDIDLAHATHQATLRQRNVLAALAAGLAIALVVMFTVAQSRDREVVLVPVLHAPVTLTNREVSADYLEMVTRDMATLVLNRSPDALDYWMKNILAVTDERARGDVKASLMKIVSEEQGSQITQFFTPDSLQVNPGKLESTVGGIVHTVVASKEVTSEHRSFRFVWSYNGVSLRLIGFGMIVPGAAHSPPAAEASLAAPASPDAAVSGATPVK